MVAEEQRQAAAAFSLGAAGIACLVGDGLGRKPLRLVYVAGILLGTFALIPLGVGLAVETVAMDRGRRSLTVPGLILVSQWYGALILAGTWVAAGLLHLAGAFPLVPDGIPVSDRRVVAESV